MDNDRKGCVATTACRGIMRKVIDNVIIMDDPPYKRWWWYCPLCGGISDGGTYLTGDRLSMDSESVRLRERYPNMRFK